MDITHYTFAFFVFILLCVLILIYSRLMRGKKKDETGSFEKEQRLFKLYQNIEDMLGSFEEYAEESKKEISRALEQVSALISEAKNAPKLNEPETNKPAEKEKEAVKETSKKHDDTNIRPEDRIPQMVEKGMKKSEIAKELGLTIREVTLIMDIKKIAIPDDKS